MGVDLGHDMTHSRFATFEDMWCNSEGWIVNAQTCAAVKNGGCSTDTSFVVPVIEPPIYEHVVTIAGKWTGNVWHFVGEALVGLAALPSDLQQSTFIHVSEANSFVLQWLALFGIDKDRVISGTIHAQKLVVPEQGKCGNPTPHQIKWIASKIQKILQGRNQKQNKIVLIKRTKSRALYNFAKVESEVRKYAQMHGLDLYIHDDSHLPLVFEQLAHFANASMVVAPHGAGLINLLACVEGTQVIELMDLSYMNICYTRLSVLMEHEYHGVPVRHGMVDLDSLRYILKKNETI